MIGTGLAVLGAGLLGAGATAYAANKAANVQKEAASNAADIQRQGQDKALAFQQDVFNRQTGNYADAQGYLTPFIRSGQGANNLLSSFYGLGADPALGQSALERFRQSPDYQFALRGGSEALDNSAAARGGVLGGNQIRAQTEYGQGLATQNLGNYLQRITGMSQQGQQAGGYLGQLGTNLGTGIASSFGNTALTGANNIANSTMAGGTAEASGILGVNKGINSGLSALSLYNQMGQSSYKPQNLLASYNGNQIGGLY